MSGLSLLSIIFMASLLHKKVWRLLILGDSLLKTVEIEAVSYVLEVNLKPH